MFVFKRERMLVMSNKIDKHFIIWSDINLDFEDWKDDLSEQYPDLSEEELMQIMYERNNDFPYISYILHPNHRIS